MPKPDAVRAIDALPDGVVIADELGAVRMINSVAARQLGVPRREAAGLSLADVLVLTDREGCTWLGYNTPYDGLRTRTGVPEQSWLLPSGEEVLVTAKIHRAEPLGPVTGVAIIVRSGRGRARLDRDRSDLVATVAHELRSPLSGVRGFVQALLQRWDKLTDEQRRLMLETVNADSERLARLIGELLDVARLDTGRLMLDPRPVDLGVLVQRTVDSVQATTARPFRVAVDPDLPPGLADPDKFTQVVTNVIENAVRHGAGEVWVSVTAHDRARLRIEVSDEGPGIPPRLRNAVMTKFWSSGGDGSGLGLYLVAGIARAHGGAVTIAETAAGGARILIDWPAAGE